MTKFKDKYRSESHRWQYWDYSAPGNYYLTVNVFNRQCILGNIANRQMQLSVYGEFVADQIQQIPTYHPRIQLDACVIMPDHFHLLVTLKEYDFYNGVWQDQSNRRNIDDTGGPVNTIHVNTIHELYPRTPNYHPNPKPPPLEARQYWYQKPQTPDFQPSPDEIKEYRKHRRKMIISKMIGKLKMQTSKQINDHRKTPGISNWLPNYHDRVIRTEVEYQRVKNYIIKNPENWKHTP